MFGQNIYLTYQAERPQTMAERREAADRRGEAAAMLSHRLRALGRLARAVSTAPLSRRPQPVVVAAPDRTTRPALYLSHCAEAAATRPVLVGASARSGGPQ